MAEYGIPIAIIAALIVLNGLFVAAEFAIAGAPRTRFAQRAAEGHRASAAVHHILSSARNQDRYIATAQLGITFASLGLGMYGEHQLATWIYDWLGADGIPGWLASHAIASVIAISVMTYFHVVVGEMVPKGLALQHAEGTALWVTPPMLWIRTGLFPLVVGLNGIGNGVLRLMGIRREAGSEQLYSVEELDYIVRESEHQGSLASEPARILRELFEFGTLTAEDVMVPRVRVTGIPLGASAEELRALVQADRHTSYPVYDRDMDHVVGAAHIKQLLKASREGHSIEREAVQPVPLVPETSKLDNVLAAMRREGTQMVVVMDEHGGTAGIVSLEDLFEEVVGEFQEGEVPEDETPGINGRVEIDGTVRIEEAGERLDQVLEHDDVETVSGLILTMLDRPPVVGDVVDYDGVRFTVTEVEGNGVTRTAIELVPRDKDEDNEEDED